ncbi:MAG: metallophosphoesterase family protein [Acidobacteriaceae bacterium]
MPDPASLTPTRIGVISDTHGLLRPEALAALAGVAHILHAGDVGDPAILDRLRQIAPVSAIRGNIDTHGPCAKLPPTKLVTLGGTSFYLLHDLHQLNLDPRAAGIDVVVSGHSHRPGVEERRGVLYLNPGSAGPRRFSLPISLAVVRLAGTGPVVELVHLAESSEG